MDRLDRIKRMNSACKRALGALKDGKYDLPEYEQLSEYIGSGLWQSDYEADEAGLLPKDVERGVLSQDTLYDLLNAWEEGRRRKKHVVHIFGASGSGTTTLGKALSKRLDFCHMDSDDYYWLPADPMFTLKRSVPERIALMNSDIDAAKKGAVISGSLTKWGDPLIPRFTLVVRVVTDTMTRIERLAKREYERFGDRIYEGGDMHVQHMEFLNWAAQYDTGDVNMRSRKNHDAWQQLLPCPVVEVNGAADIDENVEYIVQLLNKL